MNIKSKYRSIAILCLLLFYSCDGYLDPEAMVELTADQATKDYNYSKSRVASIYADIRAGFSEIGGAMMASASDEAEHAVESSNVHHFNRGTWNQFSNPDNAWSHYYRAISKVNQYLISSDSINLDRYKHNPDLQDAYRNYLAEIHRWRYEVRFLRAYFYFELIKRYGGVPLIKTPIVFDDNLKEISRDKLGECIQFILDECDSAAVVLPPRHASEELGRITKVTALALKSRVLLYAASDLFNNPGWATGYANPELISLSGESREKRWADAADAAKEVIELAESNGYALSGSYTSLFGPNTHTNNEVLFFRREGNSNSFERNNFSVGFDLGGSGTNPSQNLVDAYEMRNGKPINDNNSGYNPQNPYINRDPRLEMTIIRNNSQFKGRIIETFEGGLDGPPIIRATKTGYYLRKYVNEDLNLVTNQTSTHSWVIFRLAELYLNYAEALNESDPGNSDIAKYINKVRQRSDVNMPAISSEWSQLQIRERIYNERRVEFAFEGHRFWDLRRWMIASDFLSAPLSGVKINKNPDYSLDYSFREVETRVFSPKMYLYPIPQNEIRINKSLIQNPLWN
ncbi:RagB/SusD family nutrient uptake outer membrane protein [Proteiniphilum sp. UBA5384]|uniref:RagB/SusD family nutrient uptake outer membrane protein n=1 Tax=Proteiniphilum sp. UBA5384 TaxID=1947279 RepID=UPI0025F457C6|nr:RagB/SusD family nutrient uptake outer membrane protein [Proteiniphilum sp. UBA5384]